MSVVQKVARQPPVIVLSQLQVVALACIPTAMFSN
jgi:hypothetical protein